MTAEAIRDGCALGMRRSCLYASVTGPTDELRLCLMVKKLPCCYRPGRAAYSLENR
jgi:hypothetical protein